MSGGKRQEHLHSVLPKPVQRHFAYPGLPMCGDQRRGHLLPALQYTRFAERLLKFFVTSLFLQTPRPRPTTRRRRAERPRSSVSAALEAVAPVMDQSVRDQLVHVYKQTVAVLKYTTAYATMMALFFRRHSRLGY